MKITKKKPVKEVVKAKAAEVKAKVKGIKARVKGKFGKSCAVFAALALAHIVCGCSTADPASRSNENRVGDIKPNVNIAFENSSSNVVSVIVPIKLSDGLMASADSKGSTETQTATATTDVKPDLDVRYNDAIAGATSASKGILESLGSVLTDAGKASLLSMIESKSSGTITLDKKDGTKTVVECKDGQCTTCTDCTP